MWSRIPPELRRYLWIEGRSSRREWWRIEIIAIASYWFVGNGAAVVAMLHDQPPLLPMPVRLLLGALMFWINIASTVRRLHDRNKSGWWSLAYLFPVFGILWHFIECGLLPPRNQGYGPPEPAAQSPYDALAAVIQQGLTGAAQQPTMPRPMQQAAMRQPAVSAARGPRIIGPAHVSAVSRTRSSNKLVFAIAAAIAIALFAFASSLLTLRMMPVGITEDAGVFSR